MQKNRKVIKAISKQPSSVLTFLFNSVHRNAMYLAYSCVIYVGNYIIYLEAMWQCTKLKKTKFHNTVCTNILPTHQDFDPNFEPKIEKKSGGQAWEGA